VSYDRTQTFEHATSVQVDGGLPAAAIGAGAFVLEARRILEEAREALDRDVEAARLCVAQLSRLLDHTDDVTPPASQMQGGLVRGGLAPWQLRRVREHVAAHLAEPLPIGPLAALVRLSASHFTRAFRASVGMSPHAFIMRERIELAKHLMLETDAPICEIALNCGLADQAHMTRLFTRAEGLSPAAWRRLHMQCPSKARAA